jgi:hypothetical protein
MLLQTNSYIVPKERRAEHARLMKRFRQILHRIGCDDFEVYEQVGNNWSSGSATGRFVQIMRFRDRKHQLAVQNLERTDPTAQELIAEFCELVNYPYQQQNGLFAVGFYNSVLPVAPVRSSAPPAEQPPSEGQVDAVAGGFGSEQPETEQLGEAQYAQMALDEAGAQATEEQVVEDQATAPEDHPAEEAVAQDEGAEQAVHETGVGETDEGEAAAAAAEQQDEWAVMDEARVTAADDEDESLGFDLHPTSGDAQPAEHDAHAAGPANGDMNLGPEDEDDLARMADRLAETDSETDDTPQADSNRPRRR